MPVWAALNPKDWLLLGLAVLLVAVGTLSLYRGARIDGLQKELKEVKAEYAGFVATQSALAAEAKRQAEAKFEEQKRATSEIEATYVRGLTVTASNLDATLKRLRVLQASAGNRRPAQASPAECRAYDASPTQLSEQDREFLVRLGAEADGLANQVNALQGYIREITK